MSSDIVTSLVTSIAGTANTNWKSVTSIISTAFLIVPKIKELASDLPGEKKFDILIEVLENAIDASNVEAAAELKADLRGLLLPAVSAFVTVTKSNGDAATTVAAVAEAVAETAKVAAVKCTGWKCFSKSAATTK